MAEKQEKLNTYDSLSGVDKNAADLWNEFEQAESGQAEEPAEQEDKQEEIQEGQPEKQEITQPDDEQSPGKKHEAEPEDIWSSASEQQRAAFAAAQEQLKKLEQADRSNRGRVSAMQRQINEILAKTKQAAPEKTGAANKDSGQGQSAEEGFISSKEWKQFQEEYPEEAQGPMGDVIKSLLSHTTNLESQLSVIGEDRRQAAIDEQVALLASEHADWETVVASNYQTFENWVNSQPRHIQEAAYRNAKNITDAAEAADVVGRFKTFLASEQQKNNGPAANSQAPNNNKLTGKRQVQLASATAARSKGPSASSGIPEDGDPESIWRQFDEMERRASR